MKLKIGNYEVEVTATLIGHEGENPEDTKGFLNLISSSLAAASKENKREGYEGLAEFNRDMSNDIYDSLDATGYYDNFKVY